MLDGFDNFVKQCISSFASTTNPIDCLSYKLKEIKKSIKLWVPERSRNWKSRLQVLEDSIQDIDLLAESSPISPEIWDRKQELRRKHHSILLEQEIYWKQRSRVQWLKEGDLNTSFFHKIANGRRRINFISYLIINGRHSESLEVIRNSIE